MPCAPSVQTLSAEGLMCLEETWVELAPLRPAASCRFACQVMWEGARATGPPTRFHGLSAFVREVTRTSTRHDEARN